MRDAGEARIWFCFPSQVNLSVVLFFLRLNLLAWVFFRWLGLLLQCKPFVS